MYNISSYFFSLTLLVFKRHEPPPAKYMSMGEERREAAGPPQGNHGHAVIQGWSKLGRKAKMPANHKLIIFVGSFLCHCR
ncbi:hypothetical protein XELAEV_18045160mg [Xenopus laevis]|uniref:Uncharacterized protein n=1 Tax=Xenopus laevis TaxID=8355 RepID=A0A974C056_XENLA|nr:hypothetical protein XELAEV_18045160mg [Xenopus laevis]